jgi:class 3 adenylate cyclase
MARLTDLGHWQSVTEAASGGLWVIMFTDLVDSTAQRARLGDLEADALDQRLQQMEDAVVAGRGRIELRPS